MAWKLIDHTADVCLEVEAQDWPELLREATAAFGAFTSGGSAAGLEAAVERRVEADGVDAAETWVRWWRALHRLWTVEGLLAVSAAVDPGSTPLASSARVACMPAEAPDAAACVDVKAVTWHGAQAGPEAERWRGRIVLDV